MSQRHVTPSLWNKAINSRSRGPAARPALLEQPKVGGDERDRRNLRWHGQKSDGLVRDPVANRGEEVTFLSLEGRKEKTPPLGNSLFC